MISLEYSLPPGPLPPEQAAAKLALIPDLRAGKLERSILAAMGVGALLLDDAVAVRGTLTRRIGFASTPAFDAFAPTDDAKIAALTNLFTAAIGVQTGAVVTASPVDLTALDP